MFPDLHVVGSDDDLPGWVKKGAPGAHIEILLKNFSKAQNEIGRERGLTCRSWRGVFSRVEAEIVGMRFIQHTLVHAGESEGKTGALE